MKVPRNTRWLPCSRCRETDASVRCRAPQDGLDEAWLCDACVQLILDDLAGWMFEHDRLVSEGVPEATVFRINRDRMANGESPPKVLRA